MEQLSKLKENKIKSRIRQHGQLQKIDELCLDQISLQNLTASMSILIQKCIHLEYLTLNNCNLHNIQYFPRLDSLIMLQLMDNHLKDQQVKKIAQQSQNLKQLYLTNNKIQQPVSFKKFKKLQCLSIGGNLICQKQNYRQEIFDNIKTLLVLDGANAKGLQILMLSSEDQSSSTSSKDDYGQRNNSLQQDEFQQQPEKVRKLL